MAALLSPGSHLHIRGVGLNPTRSALLDFLVGMGARIGVPNLESSNGELIGDLEVEYSELRGGLIDVYPVTAGQPYRLDFFGDTIEDIRAFDPVTQRSGDRVERVTVAASPRLRVSASFLLRAPRPIFHLARPWNIAHN